VHNMATATLAMLTYTQVSSMTSLEVSQLSTTQIQSLAV
jgi:hypothetical protein